MRAQVLPEAPPPPQPTLGGSARAEAAGQGMRWAARCTRCTDEGLRPPSTDRDRAWVQPSTSGCQPHGGCSARVWFWLTHPRGLAANSTVKAKPFPPRVLANKKGKVKHMGNVNSRVSLCVLNCCLYLASFHKGFGTA